VAHTVSADLGIKLLAPTPGARGLVKTSARGTEAGQKGEEKRQLGLHLAVSQKEKVKGVTAKDLLTKHKSKVLQERRRSEEALPKLSVGRGGVIDLLDSSSVTSKPLDAAKAKALLALKGKAIASKNPNYVPTKKRKVEEMESSRKRVARAIGESNPASTHKRDKPEAVLVSSSGSVMSKERLDAICNAKSKNEHLVEEFADEIREKALDQLQRKEEMEDKMLSTKELETKAVTCAECNYTAFSQSELCRSKGHRVKVVKTTKKFFECIDCKKRLVCLDKYPKRPCSKCGGSRFSRSGMVREKMVKSEGEKLLIRGVEQKFINQTISSEDLL